jgi:hypothetical protein
MGASDATAAARPLQTLDDGLEKANVPYSYGFAIIALTVLVKLATFPLTQKQASPRRTVTHALRSVGCACLSQASRAAYRLLCPFTAARHRWSPLCLFRRCSRA